MKKSVPVLATWMALVAFALPAIAQQPSSETSPAAEKATTSCPACKAAQTAVSTTCPASCQECQNGDKPCTTCPNSQVVTAVITDLPGSSSSCANCPLCKSTSSCDAECAACTQCPSGSCPAQAGQACQSCPSCPATTSNCTLATAGRLPGSVSFVNENASELAHQRMQLADDLVAYLTSQKQNPEHIRQVLRMALESTADDAHRSAMNMKTSETFQVATLPEANATCCDDQNMMQMRQMVLEMRSEMDMMGESMRFLARHMHEQNGQAQQNPYYQNRNTEWTSQTIPTPRYYTTQDVQYSRSPQQPTAQLQRRIRDLEQQLHRAQQPPVNTMPRDNSNEQRLSASWNPQGQLQPTAWQSEPLRPKASVEMQLNPAPMRVSTMVARQYYVGDLMSPPFASATLRLMQQIKTSVAPDSWEQASIEIVSPSVSLLVTQTPENHEKIARMLNTMRGGDLYR